jgi:RHS repeat-associated protein
VLTDGINTGCGSVGYAWNAEEQMTCAAGSSYTYDGDGIRVEKAGGDATPTLYWGGLAESDLSGNFTSEYIFASGRRIARRNVATGSVYYYFADMLGSTSTVATAAGAVENESDYYPFGGEDIVTQNLTNQHYKFTGKERDTESGNDYFGARYYASSMGRFLSPDPVGNWAASPDDPQSWNQYAYVEGNPLTMVDPDGTCPVIIAGIGMSPDSASGKDLVATAGLYGADVDFDYAGQSKLMSIANLALSGLGANGAATQSASGAMSAALADANAGGTSFFALAFSGGAQASISAGVGTGSMNPTAFYDPGTHLFQGLPAGSSEYTGSGFTSDLVRGVSGHLGGTNVPGCGHNVNCAIQRSAALQAALKNAGPCSNPQVFTRNLHYTYIPPIPMQLFPLTFYWPIPEDDESNGSGNATILPGFTPVEE